MSITICPICLNRFSGKLKPKIGFDILLCSQCGVGITTKSQSNSYLNPDRLGYSKKSYIDPKNIERQARKFIDILKFSNIEYANRDVLDIGGGYGLLSKILHSRGANVSILEPVLEPVLIRDSRVRWIKKNVEEFLSSSSEQYDVIFMLDVLEHLEDPVKILINLKMRLRNGGWVILNVPNRSSFMAKICRSWAWWMPEDHKFHFNKQSVKFLAEKSGYKIVGTQTFESLYDFKKNLDGNFSHISNPLLRKTKKLFFFIGFISLYLIFRPLIHKLGYGGLLSVVITPYES